MKNLWKGVKRMTKAATDKVINAVDSFITNKEKLLVGGILIMGIGLGLGSSMIIASQVAFN